MKIKTILCGAFLSATSSTQAAIILSSDFDANTGAGLLTGGANAGTPTGSSTLGVTWSGLETASASTLQAVAPAGGFAIVSNGANDYSNANIAFIDYNLNKADKADARGYSFTFTASASYSLSEIEVVSGQATATGVDQTYDSDLTVSIAAGGATLFTNTSNVEYDNATTDPLVTTTHDLTGISLASGTEYTVTVTSANLAGGGAYAVYDGVTLTSVPEPSSTALLGLGVLGFAVRRRR